MGDREIAIIRELSKLYEDAKRATISECLSYYQTHNAPKGEIVLVIEGAQEIVQEQDIEESLKDALKTMSTKDAVSHVAHITGANKKQLYEKALSMRKPG